jgi:hypothetical protein
MVSALLQELMEAESMAIPLVGKWELAMPISAKRPFT